MQHRVKEISCRANTTKIENNESEKIVRVIVSMT